MNLFGWREKPYKMVWRLEKEGKTSYLAGTAHFFPFRIERALTRLLLKVETVLLEGPMDPGSMEKIVQYGKQAEEAPSLYDAVDPIVKKEMNRQLGQRFNLPSSMDSYLQMLPFTPSDFLETHIQGVRPWMAFFTLWSAYLDWKHSIDMEAYHIAQKLGKKIHFLETLEEQFKAMDGIPFKRILDYVNRFEHWKSYKKQFLSYFLKGDIERFMASTPRFPTRCESILDHRDPILFERIKPFFEKGDAIAFLGISHIPEIKNLFLKEDYKITQVKS
jgi:uncharacterized protein YbaP (TraB family)